MAAVVEAARSPFQRAADEGLIGQRDGVSKNNSNHDGDARYRNNDTDWGPEFLAAVMCGMGVQRATKKVGIDITTPYKRRAVDPDFKRAWDEAAIVKADLLEQEAMRRAYHGVLKPVFQKGMKVGVVREYSDTMLLKLLSANMPDKYRDKMDDARSGSFVLNINVVNEAGAQPLVSIQGGQADGLLALETVTNVAADSSQQDDQGVREAAPVS